MQWLRYNFFIIIMISSYSFGGETRFTSLECLQSSFSNSVKNEGKFFGLLKNNLKVKKSKCYIEVSFKGILETIWSIDICREPIHIKVKSKGSQSVYKRANRCEEGDKTDFCYFRDELILNLQDQGLIFAEGQKERLDQAHGQVYCSYLIIRKYLDEGFLFSQYEDKINIYKEESSCQIPGEIKSVEKRKEDILIESESLELTTDESNEKTNKVIDTNLPSSSEIEVPISKKQKF